MSRNPSCNDAMVGEAMLFVAAQPRAFEVPLTRTALVVIDMQHQFLSPGGLSHSAGADLSVVRRIVPNVQALLKAFRQRGRPVMHTREGYLPDLSDCPPRMLHRITRHGEPVVGSAGPLGRILVRGEPGHDLIPELAPLPGERVVDKPGIGCFAHTDAEQQLKQWDVDRLVVTGVTTDVCVHTFIREANDRGFDCLLVSDACASFDQHLHDAAVEMTVQQGGLFGWTATTQALLDAIARSSAPL